MNLHKIYKQVSYEFDNDTALEVCVFVALNLSTKISDKDFITPDRYTKKVIKKARNLFWEMSDERFEYIKSIWEVIHPWEMSEVMAELSDCDHLNLGGCEKKTLKSLIEEYHEL